MNLARTYLVGDDVEWQEHSLVRGPSSNTAPHSNLIRNKDGCHDRLYCEFELFRPIDSSIQSIEIGAESLWKYDSHAIPANYEYTFACHANVLAQLVLSLITLLLNTLVVLVSIRTSRRSTVDVALSQYTRISLSYADILSALSTFVCTFLMLLFPEQLMTDAIWSVIVLLTLLQMYFITTSFCHLILMSVRR